MLRQVLRELDTRREALKLDYLKLERAKLQIDRIEAEISGAGDGTIEARGLALDLTEARMTQDSVERTLHEREREFRRFYALAKALDEQIGPVSEERREQLEQEFWQHQLRATAGHELLAHGGISNQTLESIRAMPQSAREQLVEEVFTVEGKKQLKDWTLRFQPEFPDITPYLVSAEKVRAALCP